MLQEKAMLWDSPSVTPCCGGSPGLEAERSSPALSWLVSPLSDGGMILSSLACCDSV